MLEAKDLFFQYGTSQVLQGASLSIAPGEVVGLMGPSGAGKSTIGRILAGLLEPNSGSVTIDGRDLPPTGFCPVQMLFQVAEFAVNPRWKIKNILSEAYEPTPDLLRALGIKERWLDRYPHELSGGELQRVSIVRSLDSRTRYLVADEITGMLDAITQAEVWSGLIAQAKKRGIGILLITHDKHLLSRIATRRLTLCDGRLLEDGGNPVASSSGTLHLSLLNGQG